MMPDWYVTVQQWSGVTPSSECHVSHYATSHHIRRPSSSHLGDQQHHRRQQQPSHLPRCPISCPSQHHRCRGRWSGTNKTCPSDGRWGNIGFSCVHLDYLLIATVGTLITFVCQVIGAPLLQSDGHPNTFQPTICLSLQSQPSTPLTHAGSCRIPNINLQRYP